MSAVFFHFPNQEALRTHAIEWSAQTTENGFKTVLQTVWIVHFIYYNALRPSVILSYAKNNSTYCFSFSFSTLRTRNKIKKTKNKKQKKKTRIFHQRSQKIHLDLNLSLFLLFRLNTILVTNRWNRSHLSWIFSKFLTFTPHTFVLTEMCPSPSPMLCHAYFGALRRL